MGNFSFLGGLEPLCRLGEDAERFLWVEPDLAVFRLRQFAEAAAHVVYRHRYGASAPITRLDHLIGQLFDDGHLPRHLRTALRELQQEGNVAVHSLRPGAPPDVGGFRTMAQRCLPLGFEVGVWVHRDVLGRTGAPETFVLPPRPDETTSLGAALARIEMDIAVARSMADEQGALDDAESRIARIRSQLAQGSVARDGDPMERQRLDLRCEIVAASIANHRGVSPPPLDTSVFQARWSPLFERRDDLVLAELSEYGNRLAVAELNAFRFAAADEWCSKLIAAREGGHLGYQVFLDHEVEVKDWHLGTLLGTRGQARGFLAHMEEDPEWLDLALEDFRRAEAIFSDAADRQRQWVYAMHADLERIRLTDAGGHPERLPWADALDGRARELARRTTQGGERTLDAFGDLFAADVVLKAADVLRRPAPKWAPALASALAREIEATERLPHPYESLCGRLWLLLGSACPRVLREALKATADLAAPEETLVPHIAQAFILEHRFRESGSLSEDQISAFLDARPKAVVHAWTEHQLEARFRQLCAAGGLGPLRIMPFNYA